MVAKPRVLCLHGRGLNSAPVPALVLVSISFFHRRFALRRVLLAACPSSQRRCGRGWQVVQGPTLSDKPAVHGREGTRKPEGTQHRKTLSGRNQRGAVGGTGGKLESKTARPSLPERSGRNQYCKRASARIPPSQGLLPWAACRIDPQQPAARFLFPTRASTGRGEANTNETKLQVVCHGCLLAPGRLPPKHRVHGTWYCGLTSDKHGSISAFATIQATSRNVQQPWRDAQAGQQAFLSAFRCRGPGKALAGGPRHRRRVGARLGRDWPTMSREKVS